MRTQKAKGIIKGLPRLFSEINIPATCMVDEGYNYGYALIDSEEAIDSYSKNYGAFPRFGRPCPVNPAHGFVDSQPVMDEAALRKMFADVLEADPQGEIILARQYNDIKKNFIYVSDGLVCVGPGNDGATNGNDSVSFPVCPEAITKKTKKASGIKNEDSVYMEGIHAQGDPGGSYKWRLVQLRGGPEMVVGSPDYIPAETKVKKIVKPHDDLLAWAKEVESFEPGTVVYGDGHTMASHAAVHCILHEVPFVTTFEPKVGETLKPTEDGKKFKISREDFRKGAHVAMKTNLWKVGARRVLQFSFSVLHNWAYLRNSEHASWLLGAASASLASLCAGLCLGEYRHERSSRKPHRDMVYKRALGTTGMKQLPKMTEAFKSFCFSNYWSGGYGGMKWGVCTHYAIKLYRSLTRVYNGRGNTVSDREATELLESFNRLVNLVHNGGWWFNKVAQQRDMNFVSEHPGLAAAGVSDIYFDLMHLVGKVKKVSVKLPTLPAMRPPLLNTDEGVKWAELHRHTIDKYSKKPTATISIYSEVEGDHKTKDVTLTPAELRKIKKDPRNRCYLRPKKGEGFALPGGRVAVKVKN